MWTGWAEGGGRRSLEDEKRLLMTGLGSRSWSS